MLKEFDQLIFFKNDLNKYSGIKYIYDYYVLNHNNVIIVDSFFLKFISKGIKFKIIWIFLLIPLLYFVKSIQKNFFYSKNETSKRKLVIGNCNSLTFLLYIVRGKNDTYPIDTLTTYYSVKIKNEFLKSVITFASKLIDRFVYESSFSKYCLNTYSKKSISNILPSLEKFRTLPIGIDKNYSKMLSTTNKFIYESENSNCINQYNNKYNKIGIFGNFLFPEHIIFMNYLFNTLKVEDCNRLKIKEKFIIGGYDSEKFSKKIKEDEDLKNNFLIKGEFDSLSIFFKQIDSIIIPMLKTSGIKIKLYECIASCKPTMINQEIKEHLPSKFVKYFPSLYFFSEFKIKTLNDFYKYCEYYYLNELWKVNLKNIDRINWN